MIDRFKTIVIRKFFLTTDVDTSNSIIAYLVQNPKVPVPNSSAELIRLLDDMYMLGSEITNYVPFYYYAIASKN